VNLESGDPVFRARALAQSHALSPLATRFLNQAVGEQRATQPVPEIGIWAGAGLTVGYCLRKVEENDAGLELEPADEIPSLEELDEAAVRIAAEWRTVDHPEHALADPDRTLEALDRIIASEIDRRLEHWRGTIDDKGWAELEEYITWWVVKGYALRVAETVMGALS
jgi:hypothetical protein